MLPSGAVETSWKLQCLCEVQDSQGAITIVTREVTVIPQNNSIDSTRVSAIINNSGDKTILMTQLSLVTSQINQPIDLWFLHFCMFNIFG